MNAIASALIDKLIDFLRRDFLEDEVRFEVTLRNVHVVTHEGVVELTKGSEYVLPRWLTQQLEAKGVGRVREVELDVSTLSNIAYLEEDLVKKKKFHKIPQFFYLTCLNDLATSKDKLRKTGDLDLYEEVKKKEELVETICRVRLRKILDYILIPDIPTDVYETFSNEEKVLLSVLRTILQTWFVKLGLEKLTK